jgi:methionyl-tRNA synthetase
VIDPNEVVDTYGADAFRYFVLREVPFGLDGDFSTETFVTRFNTELANDLGNLLSRVLTMVGKYFGGRIPAAGAEDGSDRELRETALALPAAIDADLAGLAFNRYLQDVWQLVTRANRYVEENAPWTLAKKNDMTRLASVLYNLAESLRLIALYLYPVIPGTAQKIWNAIGIDGRLTASRMEQDRQWGTLAAGTAVRPGGQLFPRIDTRRTKEATVETAPAEQKPAGMKASSGTELIGIEDFAKVELRVGRIVAAERVERSEKLVKLQVDIGSEVRQVVAGIGKHYEPGQLVDKRIVIVANLKPAKLMGIESQGMVLAASSGDVVTVVTPDQEINPGAKVK